MHLVMVYPNFSRKPTTPHDLPVRPAFHQSHDFITGARPPVIMDDLVLTGIAGLLFLITGGLLLLFCAASLIIAIVQAAASGQYGSVLLVAAALALASAAYIGSGLWLRKTNRI